MAFDESIASGEGGHCSIYERPLHARTAQAVTVMLLAHEGELIRGPPVDQRLDAHSALSRSKVLVLSEGASKVLVLRVGR